MSRSKVYRPTLRCLNCGRVRPIDGLRAWFFQPPWPTNGRGDSAGALRFICRECQREQRRRRSPAG